MNKFQLAATVDRLIYGDDRTFLAADASALIGAVPVLTWRRFLPDISCGGSGMGRSTQGLAAGFGNLSMPEAGTKFDFDSRGAVRIGQWKLRAGWRSIEIQQVASDSHEDHRSAIIRFSFRWLPIRMDILVQTPLYENIKFFASVGKYEPWKTPV